MEYETGRDVDPPSRQLYHLACTLCAAKDDYEDEIELRGHCSPVQE